MARQAQDIIKSQLGSLYVEIALLVAENEQLKEALAKMKANETKPEGQ
jgi:hypothetical protein